MINKTAVKLAQEIADDQRITVDYIQSIFNEASKQAVNEYLHKEQEGHTNPCSYGPLCPWCEIERLKEIIRKIPMKCPHCLSKLKTDAIERQDWIAADEYRTLIKTHAAKEE